MKTSTKTPPKVSVHVITYNHVGLIEEALNSLLAQDYPNLEIVVADDASTDGTADIVRSYAENYPDKIVPVLNPKNLGITGNSNAALAKCSGELIAFIGGDDIFRTGKISAQVPLFDDPEVVLSYHAVEVFNSNTGDVLYTSNLNPREDTNSALQIIERVGIPGACSIMVRKSAVPEKGFDTRIGTASDWLFFVETALKGKIKKLDGVYARYRKHSGNVGNRLAEYSADPLLTLGLLEAEHADVPGLKDACRRGRARYLAGHAFRLLPSDRAGARSVMEEVVALAPSDPRYRLALFATKIPGVSLWAHRMKYWLKRHAI